MLQKWNKIGGRRIGSFLMSLVLLIGLLPAMTIQTSAVDLKNLYALEVSTGTSGGDAVVAFRLDYVATDGKRYSYLINTLSDLSEKYDNVDVGGNLITDTHFQQKLSNAKSLLSFNLDQMYPSSAKATTRTGLGKNSLDTYMVRLPHTVSKVENIAVIMSRPEGSRRGEWECQGMTFFKVTKDPTRDMYGYYANQTYLDCGAEILGALDSKHIFSIVDGDYGVHNIAARNTYYYTDDEDEAMLVTDTVTVSEPVEETFIFKVDLADVYGGGIETFANNGGTARSIRNMAVPECLYMTIIYMDSESVTRTVVLPVLTSALGYAAELGVIDANTKLADFAGQGESLAFMGKLPKFFKLIDLRLTYSDNGTELMPANSFGYNGTQKLMLEKIKNNEDSIGIAGVSLYLGSNSQLSLKLVNNSMLNAEVYGAPYRYYTAANERGVSLTLGSTSKFDMRTYTANASLSPSRSSNQYLISVTTDQPNLASSTGKLTMTLKYLNEYNNIATSADIDMAAAAAEFYGYWPAVKGTGKKGGAVDSGASRKEYVTSVTVDGRSALMKKGSLGVPLGSLFAAYLTEVDLWTARQKLMYNARNLKLTAEEIEAAYIALGGVPSGLYPGEPSFLVDDTELKPGDIAGDADLKEKLKECRKTLEAKLDPNKDTKEQLNTMLSDLSAAAASPTGWLNKMLMPVYAAAARLIYAEEHDTDTDFVTITKEQLPAEMSGPWNVVTSTLEIGDVVGRLRYAGLSDEDILQLSSVYSAYAGVDLTPGVTMTGELFFGIKHEDLLTFFETEAQPEAPSGGEAGVDEVGAGEMGYYYGMKAGNTLTMLVTLEGLVSFQGVSFRNDSKTEDDWQFSHIEIRRLEEMGHRQSHWETVVNGEYSSNRWYEKDISGNPVLVKFDDKVLVQAGETVEYPLDGTGRPGGDGGTTSSGSIVTDETTSMTYEQTKQNYGFAKSRYQYTVNVQVAGSTTGTAELDDSGSGNYYYFQLIFANGKSGYVLANQQLQGDSFRTGSMSAFYISTNEDFGDLVSINIIPDDTAESSDIYDKLQIKEIDVSRSGAGSTNTWTIENVGWVGIDYVDDGENTGNGDANADTKSTGRPREKLVKNFKVTGRKTSTMLQFNVNTCEVYGSMVPGEEQKQFDGSADVVIDYLDTSGRRRSAPLDLIQSFNSYYGLGSNDDQVQVNTTLMARAGHTDRFTVKLTDLAAIRGVKITASQVNGSKCYWNIANISFGVVESDGVTILNNNEEYESTATVRPVASSNNTKAVQLDCYNATSASYRFEFDPIPIQEPEEGEEIPLISPSRNDLLNLYVITEDGSEAGGGMQGAVRFVDAYGIMKESSRDLLPNEDGYYALEMGGANLAMLSQVTLKPEGDQKVSYALVERVREGVILETYLFDFSKVTSEDASLISTSVRLYGASDTTRQVLSLDLGSDSSEAITLEGETSNVYVALEYRTQYDGNRTVYSEYVPLTDSRLTISPGGRKIVDLEFNLSNVLDITGVRLYSTGGVTPLLHNVMLRDYELERSKDAEGNIITKENFWDVYGSALDVAGSGPQKIDAEPVVFHVYRGADHPYAVNDVYLTIKTATEQAGIEQAISGSIQLNDWSGSIYLEDLRSYLMEGDFLPGSTAKLRLLVPAQYGQPMLLNVQPQQQNWITESITVEWSKGGENRGRFTQAKTRTFEANTDGYIFLMPMGYELVVDGQRFTQTGTQTEADVPRIVIGYEEKTVKIRGSAENGESHSGIEILDITDPNIPITKHQSHVMTGFSSFTFPENTSTSPKRYRITLFNNLDRAIPSFSVDVIMEGGPEVSLEEMLKDVIGGGGLGGNGGSGDTGGSSGGDTGGSSGGDTGGSSGGDTGGSSGGDTGGSSGGDTGGSSGGDVSE